MTTGTISDTDPRSIKAVTIAAGAGQWLKCRTRDGKKVYGVPSQRKAGVYYLTTCQTCTCVDFERCGRPCKHISAVNLHVALARGQQPIRRAASVDVFKRFEGD